MPMPSSRTRTTAVLPSPPPPGRARARRRGVYFTAFEIRFETTCSRRASSPMCRSAAPGRTSPRRRRRPRRRAPAPRRSAPPAAAGRPARAAAPPCRRSPGRRRGGRRPAAPAGATGGGRPRRGGPGPGRCSSRSAAIWIAASGFRSSWPRRARNWSRWRTAVSSSSAPPARRTGDGGRAARRAPRSPACGDGAADRPGSRSRAAQAGRRRRRASSAPVPLVNTMTGRSDQASCAANAPASSSTAVACSASSATSSAPAPAETSARRLRRVAAHRALEPARAEDLRGQRRVAPGRRQDQEPLRGGRAVVAQLEPLGSRPASVRPSGRRGTPSSGAPTRTPSAPKVSSRMVVSCGPVRFLITEMAFRTRPRASKYRSEDHGVGQVADVAGASSSLLDQPVLGRSAGRWPRPAGPGRSGARAAGR